MFLQRFYRFDLGTCKHNFLMCVDRKLCSNELSVVHTHHNGQNNSEAVGADAKRMLGPLRLANIMQIRTA